MTATQQQEYPVFLQHHPNDSREFYPTGEYRPPRKGEFYLEGPWMHKFAGIASFDFSKGSERFGPANCVILYERKYPVTIPERFWNWLDNLAGHKTGRLSQ